MRNFYTKLKIHPLSSLEEIKRAIQSCPNASVRKDASEILLNFRSKKDYDQLNSTLVNIGKLRYNLGLNYSDNWDKFIADEYAPKFTTLNSQYEKFTQKINSIRERATSQKTTDSNSYSGVFVLIVIAVIYFVFFNDSSPPIPNKNPVIIQNRQNTIPVKTDRISPPPKPAFTKPVLQNPKNGTIRMRSTSQALAPFEIRTQYGNNYLVKLEDKYTGQIILDIFVVGGNTVEINVPLGEFILKYASGKEWFGYKHRFGPNGINNKANKSFHFNREDTHEGYRFNGHIITLYRVVDGNLSVSEIDPDEF